MVGDVREAVGTANRDEVEKTYGEDSVRVLRVVLPSAPRFDSSSISHSDSACVPAGDGCDIHGCHSVVGDRAPQPKDNTGGTTDRVSCGMPGGRVERGAATAVPAPTIDALADAANTYNGGRCDSGSAEIDENMCGRAGGGVHCCDGGEGSAVIDAAPSPQHSTQRIHDTGLLLFDVPVVLERRYITTPPNGDKETPEPNNTSAATGMGESIDEEAGAPLLGKSRKDASSRNTRGDTHSVTTGGATSGADDEDGCFRVSGGGEHGDCRG